MELSLFSKFNLFKEERRLSRISKNKEIAKDELRGRKRTPKATADYATTLKAPIPIPIEERSLMYNIHSPVEQIEDTTLRKPRKKQSTIALSPSLDEEANIHDISLSKEDKEKLTPIVNKQKQRMVSLLNFHLLITKI